MKLIAGFLSIMALGLFFGANSMVVEVTKGSTDIYKNEKREMNEKKVYSAKKRELLTVIEEKEDLMKVRTKTGLEGWVRKSTVKPAKEGRSSNSGLFRMDEAKVQGFLDNPQAVYILDMSDPNFKPIKLDRSFSDNLGGNIDKETNQRINDPNLKPGVVEESK